MAAPRPAKRNRIGDIATSGKPAKRFTLARLASIALTGAASAATIDVTTDEFDGNVLTGVRSATSTAAKVEGVIIVAAVVIDQYRQNRRRKA